jgi:hypothetical protein
MPAADVFVVSAPRYGISNVVPVEIGPVGGIVTFASVETGLANTGPAGPVNPEPPPPPPPTPTKGRLFHTVEPSPIFI